jgi:hypothetical protein
MRKAKASVSRRTGGDFAVTVGESFFAKTLLDKRCVGGGIM